MCVRSLCRSLPANLTTSTRPALLVAAAMIVASGGSTHGAIVSWTDWTSFTLGAPGSAAGSLVTGSGSSVTVTYSGEVTGNAILPTQTGGAGTNYWDPNSTYVSSVVENGPGSAGNTDVIALAGQNASPITNTILFSSPVTNPIMAIVSLGQTGLPVTYTFNQDFSILSFGPGHFAQDTNGSLFRDGVGLLRGAGGNGVILFSGTFSSISFTATPAEGWHGFQIGAVPSPSAAALLGVGGLLVARRRR